MLSTALAITVWTLFALLVLASLALDLVGLFGNWLIVGGVVIIALLPGFDQFSIWGIGGMFLAAVVGEVLETALAGYGARRFGGSRGSIGAALVGCIVGAILGSPLMPIIGTLIGGCVGAFLAAAIYEHVKHEREVQQALWTGTGAALGKIGGIAAKFGCGLAILAIVAWEVFTAGS